MTYTNTKEQINDALETLRGLLNPGDTVYAIVRSVARSGMSRRIDFYCRQDGASKDSDLRWLTPFMVRVGVMDQSYSSWAGKGDTAGARIDGCGMDMCFEAVYRLGRKLWPDGFGEMPADRGGGACGVRPETTEEAKLQRAAGWKFRGRNGDTSGWDTDGGYALKHRTL